MSFLTQKKQQNTKAKGDHVYENHGKPQMFLSYAQNLISHLQSFWGQLWQQFLQIQRGSEPQTSLAATPDRMWPFPGLSMRG